MKQMIDPADLTDDALIEALRAMERALFRKPNGRTMNRLGHVERGQCDAGMALAAEAWNRGILNLLKEPT